MKTASPATSVSQITSASSFSTNTTLRWSRCILLPIAKVRTAVRGPGPTAPRQSNSTLAMCDRDLKWHSSCLSRSQLCTADSLSTRKVPMRLAPWILKDARLRPFVKHLLENMKISVPFLSNSRLSRKRRRTSWTALRIQTKNGYLKLTRGLTTTSPQDSEGSMAKPPTERNIQPRLGKRKISPQTS